MAPSGFTWRPQVLHGALGRLRQGMVCLWWAKAAAISAKCLQQTAAYWIGKFSHYSNMLGQLKPSFFHWPGKAGAVLLTATLIIKIYLIHDITYKCNVLCSLRKGVKKHYFYRHFVGFTPRPLREVFKKTKNVFLSIIDNYKENFTSLNKCSFSWHHFWHHFQHHFCCGRKATGFLVCLF